MGGITKVLELLASYSLGQVLVFIVVFALALKEFFNVFDFFKAKAKLWLTGEQEKEKNSVSLQELAEKIDKITTRLELLTESDKDDIRSWIVEKRNYYKAHPEEKIDNFIMDTIEKRYQHYKDEGGNSYITDMMEELRKMAKEE